MIATRPSRLRAILFAGALLAPAIAAAALFSDSATSPYEAAIEYGHKQGFLGGFADGSFKPYQTMKRAEFAKAVLSAVTSEADRKACMKKITAETAGFKDVPKDAWFAPYVCVGKARGLLAGFPDRTFRPEEQVNFAEASKIIAKAFSVKIVQRDEKLGGKTVWFRPYSLALSRRGAIPETIATFAHVMTRGEMAEIIYRLKTGKTSLPTETSFVASKYKEEGFSFAYQANVFAKAVTTAAVPFGNYPDLSGRSLIHALQLEDCGESNDADQCTPLTIDLAIGFHMIPAPIEVLTKEADDWMTEEKYTEAGRNGFTFTLGSEGNQTDYIFLPLTDDTSLMITRDYLDEDAAKRYATEKGFIPLGRQQQLFRDVLATLQFSSPLTPEALKNKIAFTLFFFSQADLDKKTFDYPSTVVRSVKKSSEPEDAALRELFKGPTAREEQGGARAGMLKDLGAAYTGIQVKDGVATVNFKPAARKILDKGTFLPLSPIRSTLLQFDAVDQVDIAGDGQVID